MLLLLLLSLWDGRLTCHTNMFRIRNASWTNTNSDRKHCSPSANRKDTSLSFPLRKKTVLKSQKCKRCAFALWHLSFLSIFISPKGLWDGDITKYTLYLNWNWVGHPKYYFYHLLVIMSCLLYFFKWDAKASKIYNKSTHAHNRNSLIHEQILFFSQIFSVDLLHKTGRPLNTDRIVLSVILLKLLTDRQSE